MRRWVVRVAEEAGLPVVQSAGRLFARGEEAVVREGEAGWEEIVGCPLLEVEEEEAGETPAVQGEDEDE